MGSTKLLDHGYLTIIESWGSDERIIEAARMSTGKGFRMWEPYYECRECVQGWHPTALDSRGESAVCDNCGSAMQWNHITKGDFGLLSFLSSNMHSTPFEMAGVVIEVQAPIFVFREWHRHRTQSYNEMSARYTPLPDLNYVPSIDRLLLNSKSNKQAGVVRDAEELDAVAAQSYRVALSAQYTAAEHLYQQALAMGVPKEISRVHLPVGRYSRMRASANLRNWLGFLTLRQAPNAQWEIRQYADALNTELTALFPRTMELFNAASNI